MSRTVRLLLIALVGDTFYNQKKNIHYTDEIVIYWFLFMFKSHIRKFHLFLKKTFFVHKKFYFFQKK
jgi:hypothetical protein